MGTDTPNGDILSSWKEVAAFLKCSVRSCIRWEKEAGLPVHRTLDARGSRIYAHRAELEAWLRARPQPSEAPIKRGTKLEKLIKPALLLVPLSALVLVVLLLVRPGRGGGNFRLAKFSILTGEPHGVGRLRVWGSREPSEFRAIWEIESSKANTVRHGTLAVGDIDGDGRSEVVVPAFAKAVFSRGEKQATYFKIFLNLYKQGTAGLWKTTFFSDGDCVWEEGAFSMNEVAVANLDRDPAAEIILKTATEVAAYDYIPRSGEVRQTDLVIPVVNGVKLMLQSVAVADLDGMDPPEIVVSANDLISSQPGRMDGGNAWLFVVGNRQGVLQTVKTIPVDAILVPKALRSGRVLGRGLDELYATAVRRRAGQYQTYLLGWNAQGEKIVDLLIPDSVSNEASFPRLALADLTFDPGDDVVLALQRNRLLVYSGDGAGLALRVDYRVPSPDGTINSVTAGDADGDGRPEIVVGGSYRTKSEEEGRFYLEVLAFDALSAEVRPRWKRVGGSKDESEVSVVAIGRR
jgi:hypothetical protein